MNQLNRKKDSRSAKHGAHETEHEDGSTDLGSVLQDGEWDESLGVDIPFPETKDKDQYTADDEEYNDSPVWRISR
jgi:hypothetical protein